MPRGGRRPGSGRPRGSANRRTREIADRAAEEGLTPLEYMLQVMRDDEAVPARRDDMAKAAAPYLHPRLQAVEDAKAKPEEPDRKVQIVESIMFPALADRSSVARH